VNSHCQDLCFSIKKDDQRQYPNPLWVNRAFIQIRARDNSQIFESVFTHAGGQTDRKTRATFSLVCIININYVHLAQDFAFCLANPDF
jgi:hypothetical protein